MTGGDRRPVTVVVVAYGAPALLDAALRTLGGAYPVTVVDNSSAPEVRAVVERFGAEYVDPGRNLGFAGGVNLGTSGRIAPGSDVLLLNPDAAIAPVGVALLQRALAADDRLAAVAPPQHDPVTGTPARVGWPFPSPLGAWVEALGLGGIQRRTDYLIGSVLLLRGEALADVGPFDDRFFLYAEEADWQRRATDRGWAVALCPGVSATHVGSGTGGAEATREAHFHASHERYLRKHHGSGGWWAYRSAALVGAAVRAVVLRGERGRQAAARFTLYRRGPLRVEAADDRAVAGTLSIVHVVLTGAFAGVERYVCQVANGLAGRGHRVEVVGGDPPRMRDELVPSVHHRPAISVRRGATILARRRDADLIHTHMTKAEIAAWLARPLDRHPTVATRHFASGRGSNPAARALASVAARSIVSDVAISEYVATTISGPSVLIPNGVPEQPQAALDAPTVVMLQRLDREKAPDVGIRAWASSGLPAAGWTLVVAGSGVLRPDLETLVRTLGCAGSVTFAGQVADTDGLLDRSSILLAPAPGEPFGLSVVEAMAHGVPVVAAEGGAHVETVGGAGILFPAGDTVAAARALDELAGDRALRRRVGATLRARQQERFSLTRHLDRLEELYRSVAAAPLPGCRSGPGRGERTLVERLLVGGHPLPGVAPGAAGTRFGQPGPEPGLVQEADERVAQRRRVTRRDEEAAVADDVGEGPTRARHHGDSGGLGLDDHPAELLDPAGHRDRGHRHDVEDRVELGHPALVDVAVEHDPVGNRELPGQFGEAARVGPGPVDLGAQTGVAGNRLQEDGHPLVGDEPSHVSHPQLAGGRVPVDRVEPVDIDAEGEQLEFPGEASAPQDPPGLEIAGVRTCRPPERPPLEPPEGRRVALLEVLGGADQEGCAARPQPAEDEHLGHGEPEGLLVYVDEIPPPPAEQAPERPGIEEEQIGVAPERANRDDEVVPLGAGTRPSSPPLPSGPPRPGSGPRRARGAGAPARARPSPRRCARGATRVARAAEPSPPGPSGERPPAASYPGDQPIRPIVTPLTSPSRGEKPATARPPWHRSGRLVPLTPRRRPPGRACGPRGPARRPPRSSPAGRG